jgi:osmotically-inducible protein OsmY
MAASELTDAAQSLGERVPHILAAAQRRLRDNPYRALSSISCGYALGVLTLRGSVPSYYLKQRAQVAVAQVEGVDRIENQIEVMNVPNGELAAPVGSPALQPEELEAP